MTLPAPVLILLAYLLGSIPFGLILTRVAGLGDIRAIGSGNIGATNVLRTGKKGLAFLTLLLDGLKGALAVWMALALYPELAPWAGMAALLGHIFPVWLRFKGGKGVATFMGVLLALNVPAGVMVMLVWLASAFILRISSLSAILSVASAPIFLTIFQKNSFLPAVLTMIFFVIVKHNGNILRLLKGVEPKIGENGHSDANHDPKKT